MTTILLAWLLPFMLSADDGLASQTPPKDTLRKVWYTLDNGLEVAVLPIPSLIAPSMQEVTIVTTWNVGSHHDRAGLAGRTHLSAQWLASRGESANGVRREIRAGSKHTWIIEKIHPSRLVESLDAMALSFGDREVDEKHLQMSRDKIVEQWSRLHSVDSNRLTNMILDRLDPLAAGPRGGADFDLIQCDEVSKFLAQTYHPGNVRIVIAGPFDPAPVITLIEKTFVTLSPGRALDAPPRAVPDPGKIKPVAASTPDTGMVARGWRVPAPGSIDALALGLFIPRANRILEVEGGGCYWDPILDPEVVILKQPVASSTAPLEQRTSRALHQIEGAFTHALETPVSGEQLVLARSGIAIQLGAYRVHEPTSMRDPYPAAVSLMLRRVFNMNENELRNNFGRHSDAQLKRLRENYLDAENSVTGFITPQPAKNKPIGHHPNR